MMRLEHRPREWPPQRGDRYHAGSVAGFNVVWRITDEHRFVGLVIEFLQRRLDRIRVGLVDVNRIVANRDFDVIVGADELESAVHHRVAFTRYHRHRMTALIQLRQCVDDSFVPRHQPIMILELERAIPVDETLPIFV